MQEKEEGSRFKRQARKIVKNKKIVFNVAYGIKEWEKMELYYDEEKKRMKN